jgi:hypothetical protein
MTVQIERVPHLLHRNRLRSPRITLTHPRCPQPHFSSIIVGNRVTLPRYAAIAASDSARRSAFDGTGAAGSLAMRINAASLPSSELDLRRLAFDQSRPMFQLLAPRIAQDAPPHPLPIHARPPQPVRHHLQRHAGELGSLVRSDDPARQQSKRSTSSFTVNRLRHLMIIKTHICAERDALQANTTRKSLCRRAIITVRCEPSQTPRILLARPASRPRVSLASRLGEQRSEASRASAVATSRSQ